MRSGGGEENAGKRGSVHGECREGEGFVRGRGCNECSVVEEKAVHKYGPKLCARIKLYVAREI